MADFAQMRVGRELMVATFFGPAARSWTGYMLDRVGSAIEAASMPAGSVLWREGEPSEHIVFIAEGRARAHALGRADWVYEGRWALGGSDVTLGRPRSRTLTLERDSAAFRLPADLLLDVLMSNVDICQSAIVGDARALLAVWSRLGPGACLVEGRPSPPPFDEEAVAGRMMWLADVPFLRGVSAQALADLAWGTRFVDVAAEEAIPSSGGAARVLVLVRGEIEARSSEAGLNLSYRPGDAVAAPVLLAGAPGWTLRARRPARLLAFDMDDWFDLMEVHPGLAMGALRSMTLERERLQELLAEREGELVLR